MTKLIMKNDTTPSTPSSGKTSLYVDSTTKKLVSKDDAGVETTYGVTDHFGLTSIGSIDHADIDTHIFDDGVHFSEASINHTNISNIGTNTHAQIDTHISINTGTNTGDQTNITGNAGTSTVTSGIQHGSGSVEGSEADAPTAGQVLTALSSTSFDWQTPSGGGGTEDVAFSSSLASTIPLTLTGSASQTASLFEVRDNTAKAFVKVSASGALELDGGSNYFGTGAPSSNDIALYLDSTKKNGFGTNGSGNNLALYNNDVRVLYWSTTSCTVGSLPFYSPNGLVSAPTFAFSGMHDGGMYRDSGTDTLRIAINGVDSFTYEDNYTSSAKIFLPGQYATGSLPTASSYEGAIAYDTTTNEVKFSDGSTWAGFGGGSTVYSNPDGSYASSERFGASSASTGINSTAFGASASAGASATAIGYNAVASGTYSTATGRNTSVSGAWSSCLGAYSIVSHTSSVVIGANSSSRANYECLIGAGSCSFTSIVFGQGPSTGAPSAISFSMTDGQVGLTNIAGANWTMKGSVGTGSGVGGHLIFQTAPAGTTGTAANTLTTQLELTDDGNVIMPNLPTSATGLPTGALWDNSGVINIA